MNSEISKIKTWYAEIENNQANYIQKDLENFLYIDGCNVSVSYWKDANSNQYDKIITNAIRDWLEIETIYYFKNGILFFVFESGYSPSEMFTPEELGITSEELWRRGGEAKTLEYYEYRLYFANETCIRYLEKKEIRDAKDEKSNMSSIPNQTIDASSVSFTEWKTKAQEFIDFIIIEENP